MNSIMVYMDVYCLDKRPKHILASSYTLRTVTPKAGTMTNSEDTDDAAVHPGLNCLLRQNQSSDKEI